VHLALLALAFLTTAGLAGACADFVIGHRRLRSLASVAPASSWPSVSIVVAARNEARGLEAAAISIVGLDYPSYLPFMQNARNEPARRRYYVAKTNEGGEKNLDRLTVVVSLVFAFTTMLLSLRLD